MRRLALNLAFLALPAAMRWRIGEHGEARRGRWRRRGDAAQGRPADAPLQLGGLRVCAVDGWLFQGDACTGLQRYNAKQGTLEPAP